MDGQRSYNPSHTMTSLHEFDYIIMVDGSFDEHSKICGWGIHCWSYRNGNIFASAGYSQGDDATTSEALALLHGIHVAEKIIEVLFFVPIVKTLSPLLGAIKMLNALGFICIN